ncbi:MAG: hypothetical protein QMD66_05510 [Actinomycetota bacterium]|nr:hypothetical protein [Actinomycetota bacterium]
MESKLITIGWIAALIMAIWILLGGILMDIIMPTAGFESYTGQAWSDFASANPRLADLYRADHREIGCLALCIATLIIGIVLTGYRRGERWAWLTLLVAGIFGWGGVLVTSIIAGKTFVLVTGSIGTVLFAIAILVPARVILARK